MEYGDEISEVEYTMIDGNINIEGVFKYRDTDGSLSTAISIGDEFNSL